MLLDVSFDFRVFHGSLLGGLFLGGREKLRGE